VEEIGQILAQLLFNDELRNLELGPPALAIVPEQVRLPTMGTALNCDKRAEYVEAEPRHLVCALTFELTCGRQAA
jgi:hypothetical protein